MTDDFGVEIRVRMRDESDVVIARKRAYELAMQQGFTGVAAAALATAVSEVSRNIVVHAGGCEVMVTAAVRAGTRGVVVTALDAGPGIPDIDEAMRDGFSTAGSLGFGLPAARRLVDEFEIESEVGVGTRITLRHWRTDAAAARPSPNSDGP
jgi:serine/threonine-protein kinase RsbT